MLHLVSISNHNYQKFIQCPIYYHCNNNLTEQIQYTDMPEHVGVVVVVGGLIYIYIYGWILASEKSKG